MIPGTKPRNPPPPTDNNPREFTTQELEEIKRKATEQQLEPSKRNYSRRELFTHLPDLLGEGLVKLLRTSNHLTEGFREQIEKKK